MSHCGASVPQRTAVVTQRIAEVAQGIAVIAQRIAEVAQGIAEAPQRIAGVVFAVEKPVITNKTPVLLDFALRRSMFWSDADTHGI